MSLFSCGGCSSNSRSVSNNAWKELEFVLISADGTPSLILYLQILQAESAIAALNCSGVVLGTLPIRLVLEALSIRVLSRLCPLFVSFPKTYL